MIGLIALLLFFSVAADLVAKKVLPATASDIPWWLEVIVLCAIIGLAIYKGCKERASPHVDPGTLGGGI
jgi:hypothetical protein